MMKNKRKCIHLDPRTRLLILLFCAILAFTVSGFGLWIVLGMMFFYLAAQGLVKNGLQFSAAFAALFGLQALIDTFAPNLGPIFGFMLYYFMRFIPVMMAANALGTASPGELISALQKMRLPKTVIIPLAVGLRYMPGMVQEYSAIRDAARLRGVSMTFLGLFKNPQLTLECALVPLLMRSLKIADELAASAATRGIEYPGYRSSLRSSQIQIVDVVIATLIAVAGVAGVWGFIP